MKRTKADLKALFVTGRKPTQQDWFDLVDSLIHMDDQQSVDDQVVNTKLMAYDTALKQRNADGVINTLGDVFKLFEGFGDATFLSDVLKWSGLPGKPATLDLQWTEQTFATDLTVFNPATSVNPLQKWLLSQVAAFSGQGVIIDQKIERRYFSIPTNGGTTSVEFYTDNIIAVKVAVNPKAKTTT